MMRMKQPCEDLRKDPPSQKRREEKAMQRPRVRNELGKFEDKTSVPGHDERGE